MHDDVDQYEANVVWSPQGRRSPGLHRTGLLDSLRDHESCCTENRRCSKMGLGEVLAEEGVRTVSHSDM